METLYQEEEGDRTITRLKITDTATKEVSRVWEFQCDACEDMSTGLTEEEARDELANHECTEG